MKPEKPALLIIDMVKDYFDERSNLPIKNEALKIIEPLNALIGIFRQRHWPVVFSTDAFQPDDFIFQGKMKPHALAGTSGAEVIDELHRNPEDLWLPKPRFSAFFKTGLETALRAKGVSLCAVAGIATHFCVLSTALDALCHDFKAVILEDCSAAAPVETHIRIANIYRRNPLFPLLRVLSMESFVDAMGLSQE